VSGAGSSRPAPGARAAEAGDEKATAAEGTSTARRSLTLLLLLAAAANALVALADGTRAAGVSLALTVVVALAAARYVLGADAQDSGLRSSVRLLGSRAPALGEWQRIVERSLGHEGAVHFATTLRPQLQRLFAARLAERHGTDLHRDPQRARTLVGADLWPWLDPEAAPPQPVPPEPVLAALLDRLDAL
jgi:hypothetical protein